LTPKSDLSGILSVDSTIEPGTIIVSSPSANHVRALDFEDSSARGSAPNKDNLVGHVPLEETESCKGENFLDTPIHTLSQSKPPSSFPYHHGWAMGRGRGVGREGAKISTLIRWYGLVPGSTHILIFS